MSNHKDTRTSTAAQIDEISEQPIWIPKEYLKDNKKLLMIFDYDIYKYIEKEWSAKHN